MATPKSAKLLEVEAGEKLATRSNRLIIGEDFTAEDDGPIKIREIPCLNDFVAILVCRFTSGIALPDAQTFKNEGVVVGIGPGLPDNNGGRVETQLKIGDKVLFSERTIAAEIASDKPPYQNQKVVLVAEKSLLCKLPPVPFEVVK